MASPHKRQLLEQAKELGIAGAHRMNIGKLSVRIREERQKQAQPKAAHVILRCSACGSTEEHHVEHVVNTGLCVV